MYSKNLLLKFPKRKTQWEGFLISKNHRKIGPKSRKFLVKPKTTPITALNLGLHHCLNKIPLNSSLEIPTLPLEKFKKPTQKALFWRKTINKKKLRDLYI